MLSACGPEEEDTHEHAAAAHSLVSNLHRNCGSFYPVEELTEAFFLRGGPGVQADQALQLCVSFVHVCRLQDRAPSCVTGL